VAGLEVFRLPNLPSLAGTFATAAGSGTGGAWLLVVACRQAADGFDRSGDAAAVAAAAATVDLSVFDSPSFIYRRGQSLPPRPFPFSLNVRVRSHPTFVSISSPEITRERKGGGS
jgi:hypothetical protein